MGYLASQTHAQSGAEPLLDMSTQKHGCFNGMVFDVGLPRTGTSSVSSFCAKLGLFSTHLMDVAFSKVKACQDGQGCGFYKSWRDHIKTSLVQGQVGFMSQADGRHHRWLQPSEVGTTGLIFEDLPTFGLACPLAKEYPNAKFVFTKRNFESYYASIRYALCAWGDGTCEAKLSMKGTASSPDLYETSKLLYGQAFTSFCEQSAGPIGREKLCGQSNGRSEEAQAAWQQLGLAEAWRAVQERHDADVRQCVPDDRLLEVNMEDDDSTKAQRIFEFLACNGSVPEFPHKNPTPEQEKQQQHRSDSPSESRVPPNPQSWHFMNGAEMQRTAVAFRNMQSATVAKASDDDDDDDGDGDARKPLWDALGKGRAWDLMTRLHPHWR